MGKRGERGQGKHRNGDTKAYAHVGFLCILMTATELVDHTEIVTVCFGLLYFLEQI